MEKLISGQGKDRRFEKSWGVSESGKREDFKVEKTSMFAGMGRRDPKKINEIRKMPWDRGAHLEELVLKKRKDTSSDTKGKVDTR